jgi:hypothetical protein
MRVKILVDGPYTDFDSDPKYEAVTRHAGDVVEYIEWYAEGLIKAGLAEAIPEPEPVMERTWSPLPSPPEPAQPLPYRTPGSVPAAGTIPSTRARARRA